MADAAATRGRAGCFFLGWIWDLEIFCGDDKRGFGVVWGFFADYLSRSLQRAVGAQIPPSGSKNEAKSILQGWDAGKDGQPAFCMLSETILFCQFEAF